MRTKGGRLPLWALLLIMFAAAPASAGAESPAEAKGPAPAGTTESAAGGKVAAGSDSRRAGDASTASDAAASKKRKRGRPKRLVRYPRAGIRYPARPIRLAIRAGRRAKVMVRLNGVRTRVGRRGWRKGVWRLRASASHGLRHRRNVLRVRVRHAGRKRARTQVVGFRIAADRPLAAAGRDRHLAAHSRIRLYGHKSRLHPSARTAGVRLRHRWRVLRAPRGSRLATGKRRARGRVVGLGAPGALKRPGARVPHFRPDRPGLYRVELQAIGPRGVVGRDVAALRVDPDPMVEFSTMVQPAGQERWGVRVGTQFFPDPGDSKKWMQVVVLRRDTLELVSNKSYDCPEATEHPLPNETQAVAGCVKQLNGDINQLKQGNAKYLVIAVSQRPSGAIARAPAWEAQPPVGARGALFSIASLPAYTGAEPMLRGRLSIVGRVGGGSTGSIVLHDNPAVDELFDDGRVSGALLRDNEGDYSTYASLEYLRFDTQAPGSDGDTNVIRVGGGVYPQGVKDGGGFHVVIVERQDLSPVVPDGEPNDGKSYWFQTGANAKTEHIVSELRRMRNVLTAAGSQSGGTLIFIASRGDARLAVAQREQGHDLNSAAQELVDVLANRLGATRGAAFRALDPVLGPAEQAMGRGQRSYSLVAKWGTPAGEGIEVEAPQPAGAGGLALNASPVTGTIERGSDHGFDVADSVVGAELEGAGVKLRDVALAESGAWPEQGNAGRTAAVSWIAGQTGLDTRRAYLWSHGSSFDWAPLKKEITGLAYPDSAAKFTQADLGWAKNELVEEIDWLVTSRDYVADLAEPFKVNQLQEWAAFQKVASDIKLKVEVPPEDKTAAKVLLLFDAVREAAESIPHAGEVIGVINVIYNTVMEWTKIDDAGTDAGEPFGVRVGDVGAALADRLKAAQGTLENQFVHVIAADYRKLRTVGLCAANLSACPDKPVSDWQVTPADQDRIAKLAEVGAKRLVYTALFPAKYDAWAPPPAPWRSVNYQGNQPAGETAGIWFCPFHNLAASAQVAYPIRRGIGSTTGAPDTWQVIAYGERTGSGTVFSPRKMETLPPAAVTDPLFKAVANGGLGADPEGFYLDAYENGGGGKTYPFSAKGTFSESEYGFPLQDSPVQWINKTEPVGIRSGPCGY